MPAVPADIALYTSDGELLTVKEPATKEQDPNALDTGDREIEMFFNEPDDGQEMIDELFAFVGMVGRPHEAIETDDTLGLGSIIPLFPAAPQASVRDETRRLDTDMVVRAYSFDMGGDSYAIELVGLPPVTGDGPTFDSDDTTFDDDMVSFDDDA